MKFMMIATALLSLNIQAQVPKVVPAPVDHLFVPQGFDNNDNIEVVVVGKLPNPCFIRNKVDIKVVEDSINVNITSLNNEDQGNENCAPMKVPFSEVVTIGNLQGGSYRIIVNGKLEEKLVVAESGSQSVDDHLYAAGQYIDLGLTGGLSGDALLVANSLSSCLELDHVEYISNGKNTFSVLPIMKKVSEVCPEEKKRMEIPLKFDLNTIESAKVLLFVRSIDGRSIHSIIDKE
jgi:hypothetical protein